MKNITANVFHTEESAEEVAARGSQVLTKVNTMEPVKTFNTKIFPNPVSDVLNIALADTAASSVIKIFSSTGELVKTLAATLTKTSPGKCEWPDRGGLPDKPYR